jgi:uncharacterized membrane protein
MTATIFPDLADAVFGFLCGRNPDHSFMVGGYQFPLCQRCAGIYAGAALSLVLDLGFRPRRGRLFLTVQSLFIFQIAPLGLGLIAGGPFLRTLSGCLFGLGLGGLLRAAAVPAPPAEPARGSWRTALYFSCAVAGAPLVGELAAAGRAGVRLLATWDLLGLASLLTLAVIAAVRRGSLPGDPRPAGPGPADR